MLCYNKTWDMSYLQTFLPPSKPCIDTCAIRPHRSVCQLGTEETRQTRTAHAGPGSTNGLQTRPDNRMRRDGWGNPTGVKSPVPSALISGFFARNTPKRPEISPPGAAPHHPPPARLRAVCSVPFIFSPPYNPLLLRPSLAAPARPPPPQSHEPGRARGEPSSRRARASACPFHRRPHRPPGRLSCPAEPRRPRRRRRRGATAARCSPLSSPLTPVPGVQIRLTAPLLLPVSSPPLPMTACRPTLVSGCFFCFVGCCDCTQSNSNLSFCGLLMAPERPKLLPLNFNPRYYWLLLLYMFSVPFLLQKIRDFLSLF